MIYVGHAGTICITSVFTDRDVVARQLSYCSNQRRDSSETSEMMRSRQKDAKRESSSFSNVCFFFFCHVKFKIFLFSDFSAKPVALIHI